MDSREIEQLKIVKLAYLMQEKFDAQGNKLGCDNHELAPTPPLPIPQGGLARLARQAVRPLGDTLDDNGDQLGSSNFALQPSQVGARVAETDVDLGWVRMCAIPS